VLSDRPAGHGSANGPVDRFPEDLRFDENSLTRNGRSSYEARLVDPARQVVRLTQPLEVAAPALTDGRAERQAETVGLEMKAELPGGQVQMLGS
jgi:hypothetical protein